MLWRSCAERPIWRRQPEKVLTVSCRPDCSSKTSPSGKVSKSYILIRFSTYDSRTENSNRFVGIAIDRMIAVQTV